MIDIETHKAIRKAIKQGELAEVVRLIGEDKSRLQMITPFGTWLHVAAAHGKLDIAHWLVSMCADVNADAESFEGSPLLFATGEGHLDVVKFLLESGAVLDVCDSVRNPLFRAIVRGDTAIAKFLIDNGIDTTVKYTGENMKDMDAMAFAKEWGRTDIMALLREKG